MAELRAHKKPIKIWTIVFRATVLCIGLSLVGITIGGYVVQRKQYNRSGGLDTQQAVTQALDEIHQKLDDTQAGQEQATGKLLAKQEEVLEKQQEAATKTDHEEATGKVLAKQEAVLEKQEEATGKLVVKQERLEQLVKEHPVDIFVDMAGQVQRVSFTTPRKINNIKITTGDVNFLQ